MALDDEGRAWVRTYVTWDPPADDDLDERFDALGSREDVAEWYLRERLTQMVDAPESFSVSGEYSESWRQNMLTLEKRLAEVQSLPSGVDASPGAVTLSEMIRTNVSEFR